MLIAFAVRTGLAGAYLTALTLNGRFGVVFGVLAVAVALIWAAPLVRARSHRPASAQV
jgi:tetrahydromethanopterin S-methyltransferase subunit C